MDKNTDQIIFKLDAPNTIQQKEIHAAEQLIKQEKLTLYHGTKKADLNPSFEFKNDKNDYGKGFYTTPDEELGKEWAYALYSRGDIGYLYEYEIDIRELEILNLTQMDSLHWLAELIAHRELNTDGREALADTIDKVIMKYKLDTDRYDIIIGYRADDSYFTYAEDFVSGAIYRDTFDTALRNGDLGLQVFIKSKRAFSLLKKTNGPVAVPEKYSEYYMIRDRKAREKYKR
ncbi:MAG: DUF3990 domain-containing protein, partial [Eubacterium sp.]|nr:DUF3990 domain-containing protein [Eubacterium sp.]